jgi:subfamily B ATP-binding cassette protein MsbA
VADTNPDSNYPEMSNLKIYIRLLSYVKRYLGVFFLGVLGLIVFSSMEIAFIDLFGYTVNAIGGMSADSTTPDKMVEQRSGLTVYIVNALSPDGDNILDTRWMVPLIMLMIALVRGLSFFIGGYCMTYVSQILVHNLRVAIFNKYTMLPASYFDSSMAGHLVARTTFIVSQVTHAATSSLKVMIRESALVIGLISYLFYLNWKLTLIFLTVLPIIGLVVLAVSKRFRKLALRIQSSMGDVTQVTQELVGGYRDMHLYGAKHFERQRMRDASKNSKKQQMKLSITESISTPVIQLLVASALSFLMWLVLDPAVLSEMSGGDFVKFLASAALLAKPVRALSGINSKIQQGIAAAGTLFSTLDNNEEVDEGVVEKKKIDGSFEFSKVNFSYDVNEKNVLNGVTFNVKAGETVALVGRSGSGKSTLISMIPRFYEINDGMINLDGKELKSYKLENLRSHIALVSQKISLFNDSIYNNIAYGTLANKTKNEVRAAANAANALEFIEQLPNGFDTIIGDQGMKLSGGQRQRLAIARAILKDAPILILDEATSALDTQTERYIQEALEAVMRGRTTFVIAHRLTTIESADRILMMSKGKIVEQGTHEELLKLNKHYAKLHNKIVVEEKSDSND